MLYIEDKEDNLELFEQVVQLSDHSTLYTAVTGEAGMKLAIDCQPDLVFLDFHLPDCEGDQAIRAKCMEASKYKKSLLHFQPKISKLYALITYNRIISN